MITADESSMSQVAARPARRDFRNALARGCAVKYLDQLKRIWRWMPDWSRQARAGAAYGRYLHAVVRSHAPRAQYFGTFFLRNRVELDLMCRLLEGARSESPLRLAVLACSKGAEVYSIAWAIRTARPDLKVCVHAIDISREIVDFAERGVYSRNGFDAAHSSGDGGTDAPDVAWNTDRDQNAPIFERMTDAEFHTMFELDGDCARVRPHLKEGIVWLCADAADVGLAKTIGLQDVVVANRFLCHMQPAAAESCLRNIARLVRPGGYLFVSGIDLDIREKVARQFGWTPVTDSLREMHEGDPSLRKGWPLEYWGLEPFRETWPTRDLRYASAFRIGPTQGALLTESRSYRWNNQAR